MIKGARKHPQVALRLPPDLKAWIEACAEGSSRSINSEVVVRLTDCRRRDEQAARNRSTSAK